MPQPKRPAVSQSAIAQEAGVARTTVSLALRGGKGLTPETIARVMEAAESLGYRPNNLVHAIRSGRTRMIGVMVPPYDSYWADVLHGIHDELIDHDYVPLALWSRHRTPQNDEALELRQVERLVDWRVDGAILWPWFANLYHNHINDLKKRGMPLVTIDSVLPSSFSADAVLSDETKGAADIAEHLLGLGHRRILHFAGPSSESWSRERRDCFTRAIAKKRDAVLHTVELPFTTPRQEIIRETLKKLSEVTAVFCATDKVAEEVYMISRELGLEIPEKISVVGYGDVDFASRLSPPLTTVRHSPFRIGKAAARLVIERIESSKAIPPRLEKLPVEFIPRLSTGSHSA